MACGCTIRTWGLCGAIVALVLLVLVNINWHRPDHPGRERQEAASSPSGQPLPHGRSPDGAPHTSPAAEGEMVQADFTGPAGVTVTPDAQAASTLPAGTQPAAEQDDLGAFVPCEGAAILDPDCD